MILFCIDCSESMHELRDDPVYENVQTSHLLAALDAAMQTQKKKVVVGPNDSVGILLFNTVRFCSRLLTRRGMMWNSTQTQTKEVKGYASEVKKNAFVYQQIAPVNAPTIQELIRLIDGMDVFFRQCSFIECFVLKRLERTRIYFETLSLPYKERRCLWATCSRVVTG